METLKLRFFAAHGKTSYLFFWGADFHAPKSGHQCENRSVLGPGNIPGGFPTPFYLSALKHQHSLIVLTFLSFVFCVVSVMCILLPLTYLNKVKKRHSIHCPLFS